MDVFQYVMFVIVGIAMLVWGADKFVEGAASTARKLDVSPLIIGLTIVSLGTSAPEILVAVMAAIDGSSTLAIGNAVGSNITNILLILGVTALLVPLTVQKRVVRIEMPILLLVTGAAVFMLVDMSLDRLDGIILVVGVLLFTGWVIYSAKHGAADIVPEETEETIHEDWSTGTAVMWLLIGLAILLGGSKLVVDGAVALAQMANVSQAVIGVTIVAIGTSLPELAASITGAKKGEHGLAIGNVVGSNMYNLLAVLGAAAVIQPEFFGNEPTIFFRDVLTMAGVTLLLYIMVKGFGGKGSQITRTKGIILLAGFVAFQIAVYLSATGAYPSGSMSVAT